MQTDVEKIKDALSIVDVINKYVSGLNKSGRLWKANCPFHDEKTPSFIVDESKQRWHCFGTCNIGGDVIEFIKQHERCEFIEALKICADIAGINLTLNENSEKRDYLEKFYSINELAAQYFANNLSSDAGNEFKLYLENRQFNASTIAEWKLGCVNKNQKGLIEFLGKNNITMEDMIKAGLALDRSDENANQDIIDRFRNKLMIPIMNPKGNIIGFGARTIEKDFHPKYLNSPASPTFDKKSILFGMNLATQEIRKKDQIIIVEGYFDVIGCYQHGIKNVVASMGTAITGNQLKSITKLTKNIIFALDGDSAGVSAALKGISTASEELDGEAIASIDWQGLVSLQEKFSAQIKIADMPSGEDPDSIVQKSKEKFLELIENSQYITDYLIQHNIEGQNITDPRLLSEAINQVIPSVAEISDPIVRAHYAQKLTRLAKVEESYISQQIANHRKQKVRIVNNSKQIKTSSSSPVNYGPEEQILRLIIMNQLELKEFESIISSEFFEDSINKEIFSKIASGIEILSSLDDLEMPLIEKINMLSSTAIPAYTQEEVVSMISEISTRIKLLRKKEILNKQAQDIADELKEQREQKSNLENNENITTDSSSLEDSLDGLSQQSKELFQEMRSESNEAVE
ncbi:MAG: DNA primase [Dehalococcoidaceae bacterium]|nr:DNA primase [Dehalococcoidaceae bacterium]